jgi:hypothetical protein
MDIDGFYRSLHAELSGLQDRVRFLIGDAHWPTDGGWKESVLRTVLRRALGSGVEVGHGFFLGEAGPSKQLDILIYRSDSPVLFRDGSLVIVPGEAVLAIGEVKTRLSAQTLRQGVDHLLHACNLLPTSGRVMVGLFAYESAFASNMPILEYLRATVTAPHHSIDLLSHGPDRFIRYWHTSPADRRTVYQKWHSYTLGQTAFGYFVYNLVAHLMPAGFPRFGAPFFPRGGKERNKDGEIFRVNALMEVLHDE